jgi:hypothetical protein
MRFELVEMLPAYCSDSSWYFHPLPERLCCCIKWWFRQCRWLDALSVGTKQSPQQHTVVYKDVVVVLRPSVTQDYKAPRSTMSYMRR